MNWVYMIVGSMNVLGHMKLFELAKVSDPTKISACIGSFDFDEY